MLRLGTVVLGADDVERAVRFWSEVFGYEVVRFEDADDDFTILVPPDRVDFTPYWKRPIPPSYFPD